ncbi:MAG TPA: PspC domain-containing protein [Sporichthya sp.]|nr:PspC domain-containing protein [Sporichthya sp.]
MDTRALGLDTSAELGPAADGSPRARYRRRREERLLAGVAGGLADHLGLNPMHVRIAFACLTGIAGFGVVLYGAFWVLIPQAETAAAPEPPGLAAASRRGLRRLPVRGPESESIGQLVALLAVALGAVLALQQTGLGVNEVVLWPALAVVAGLAVVWWQIDEADRTRPETEQQEAGAPRRRRALVVLRYLAGAVLVALGLASFLLLAGGADAARRGLFGGAVLFGGAALILGPWLLRTWRSLADERAERIRSQMHADLAAHLHDSVLQTLALIQRQAADPREVTRLARAQERDLRAFLYGDSTASAGGESLAVELRRVAAEVEDQHGVPVEVVTVGDAPLDEARRALLAAAREAMVNAAVHARVDLVDVYAEVEGETVRAYVRDRGTGFDPDGVPEDRAGVRHSILGRMERHGGRARIRSSTAEGTEIELTVGES